MRVDHLRLQDFRNVESLDLALDGELYAVWGDNGQGKTNLLESLYLLANLKSFRGARRAEMIRWGCPRAQVAARVSAAGIGRRFEVELTRERRTARLDGKDPRSLASYFAGLRAVAFTPEDPAMVRGGPGGRRDFLDRGVFLSRPDHVGWVRELTRLVGQKNALLRSVAGGRGDRAAAAAQLDVWNARLAEVGAEVSGRRAAFVAALRPHLGTLHAMIAGHGDGQGAGSGDDPGEPVDAAGADLDVEYRCDVDPGDAAALAGRLDEVRGRELDRARTLVGPQRDELVLRLGGRDLRTYGSQGQVRSAALALKLALLETSTSATGDPPLFLLDDLGSELDPARNERLLEHLCAAGGQVFVATTTLRHVPLPAERYAALQVKDGRIVEPPA